MGDFAYCQTCLRGHWPETIKPHYVKRTSGDPWYWLNRGVAMVGKRPGYFLTEPTYGPSEEKWYWTKRFGSALVAGGILGTLLVTTCIICCCCHCKRKRREDLMMMKCFALSIAV